MLALKKSIRSYCLKKRWTGSGVLDRIHEIGRKRLLSVATRLAIMELEVLFGREHTLLSRLRDHLIERLYEEHSWLMIDNMDCFVDRFPLYDEKNK